MNASAAQRYSLVVFGFLFVYVAAWTAVTYLFDPAVPYDAVEALSWATNAEFGSPKNPYVVGAAMAIGQWLLPVMPLTLYWYLSHFIGVAVGMLGVWLLSRRLFGDNDVALLAFMSLNLAGMINFDIIPYNDNYLLVMLWPYMFLFFIKAIYDNKYFWFAMALVTGLAAMSKYSTFAFLPFMLIYTLWVPAARKAYKTPVIYLAILLFLLVLAPNIYWLSQHDYAAFHWVHSEVDRGLNRDAVVGMLVVFYPALVVLALLLTRGAKLALSNVPERNAVLFIFVPPVLLIVAYFTLHSGARPTEWLHPFAILTPVVVFSFLNVDRAERLHHVTYLFAGIAVVFCVLYATVLVSNIRGAGAKFKYINAVGPEINALWREKYGRPLRYVGGSHFSHWMTIYAPDHPRLITPWSNDAKPNVYNAQITRQDIYENGAILVGEPGGNCAEASFDSAMSDFPGISIAERREYSFMDEEGRRVTVCLGFLAPRPEK